MITQSVISPYAEKCCCNSGLVAVGGKLPTCSRHKNTYEIGAVLTKTFSVRKMYGSC